MAILSDADRVRIWRGLMRYASAERMVIDGLGKSDVRAAVDATDDWIEANQASFNAALPALVQSNLTTAQKTLLFCAVAAMRVSPEFTRALLGEID